MKTADIFIGIGLTAFFLFGYVAGRCSVSYQAERGRIVKRIAGVFNEETWPAKTFSVNDGPLLQGKDGETRFYGAKKIDATIGRLNAVLNEINSESN